MAMSKKTFAFALLVVSFALGGIIALVFLKPWSTKDPNATLENDEDVTGDSYVRIGRVGTSEECRQWLKTSLPWNFAGRFGRSAFATRLTKVDGSEQKIIRNSYWLKADDRSNEEALRSIRFQACTGKIPVIAIKMRPSQGLRISHSLSTWEHYKPPPSLQRWEEYDVKLNKLLKDLENVPAVVLLEPDLLMYTGDVNNQQNRWMNEKYENEFLKRAQRVIQRLYNSWVYVDAGNAAYLGENAGAVERMSTTLLRLPGLRGFSINGMHFVNQSYNEKIARRLTCRTGLHYVVDTSRNGGAFSRQALHKITRCLFDPPNIKKGQSPGWSWGSRAPVLAPRYKRWIQQIGSSSDQYTLNSIAPQSGNEVPKPTDPPPENLRNDPNYAVNYRNNLMNTQRNNRNNVHNNRNDLVGQTSNSFNANNANHNDQSILQENHRDPLSANIVDRDDTRLRSVEVAIEYLQTFKSNLRSCLSKKSTASSHDANVWIKTPGESDGRLYDYGAYRSCLMGHKIECDNVCQMLLPESVGQKSAECQCKTSTHAFESFPLDGDFN